MADKLKTFTNVKIKENLTIGGSITVPSIISTGGIQGPSFVSGTEVVKTVDTTSGTNNSYSTIAAALTALSKESGDIGVIQLTEGQSYTLTDLDFSQCQRNFRKVVIRGTKTITATTTVTSVGDGGPGKNANSWKIPTVSDTLTNLAHADTICYNSTIDQYFAIDTNDTTTITPTNFVLDTFNYIPFEHFYGVNDRQGFATNDSLVLFTPSPTINSSSLCTLTSIPGGEIHFVEINLNLSDGCNIFCKERLVFEGCIIVRDDTNSSGNNDIFGPITAPVTILGCYSSNAANDSGFLTNTMEMKDKSHYIINSKLTGGNLMDNPYNRAVANLISAGSRLDLILSIFFGDAYLFGTYCNSSYSLFTDNANIMMSQSTLTGSAVFLLYNSKIRQFLCLNVNTYLRLINCEYNIDNSDTTNTGNYGLYIDGGSIVHCLQNVNFTVAGTTGVYISGGSQFITTNRPPNINGSTSSVFEVRKHSKLTFASTTVNGNNNTNTGNGIVLTSGSSCVFTGTPYTGTFSSGAGTAVKVGDNAVTSFATIATGLAADVNDYGTASPQMCFAVY